MTEESEVMEKIKSMLGVEAEPEVFEVEKGHIKRFAQAVGDPNPLWQDEKYACQSRYGSIIAPPTFLQDEGTIKFADNLMEIVNPARGFLNGGMEVECYKPMRPGDIITTRAKLGDIYEKKGKMGKMLFMVVEVSYTNQQRELVAIGRHTFIRR